MNVDIIKHDTNSTCEYILPQKITKNVSCTKKLYLVWYLFNPFKIVFNIQDFTTKLPPYLLLQTERVILQYKMTFKTTDIIKQFSEHS